MGICYENLCVQKLAAGLVISNFIEGIEPYSYEDYLLEFVNKSPYFLKRSTGSAYTSPKEEAHGEYDCISADYQLDFKLLSSQSLLKYQRLYSPQIYYENGCTSYCISRKSPASLKYVPYHATRIFVALRLMSDEDFERVSTNPNKKDTSEQDIFHTLKVLRTNKNILAFFPYNFYFQEPNTFEDGLPIIMKAMNGDFHKVLVYRSKCNPDKDTFLCFLYKGQIVLTEWKDERLQFRESLPIESSPLFMKLLDFTDDVFSGGSLK